MTEREQTVGSPTSERSAQTLAKRRAAVVGVESVAGAAIARALGAAGADLALCALRADDSVLVARRVQRELQAAGRHAVSYVMDVTLGRNVQVTTRQIAKELGGLDAVVSASLLPAHGPLDRLSEVEVAQILALNFTAHLFVVRSAALELARSGGGTLLLLTHEVGETGASDAPLFAAAQAAARSLVTSLAVPLANEGVALAAISLSSPASDEIALGIEEAECVGALAVDLVSDGLDSAGRIVAVGGGVE